MMKENISIFLIILFLFSNGMGQSGRKIDSETKPSKVSETEEQVGYSESKPSKNRPKYFSAF